MKARKVEKRETVHHRCEVCKAVKPAFCPFCGARLTYKPAQVEDGASTYEPDPKATIGPNVCCPSCGVEAFDVKHWETAG